MKHITTVRLALFLNFILFYSLSHTAIAQTEQKKGITEIQANNGDLFDRDVLTTLTYEGVTAFSPPAKLEGSVYLDENFVNSKVVAKDKKMTIQNVALRYNIFNDAMEFSEKNQIRSFFIDKIESINLGGDIFVVVNLEKEGKQKAKYMKAITAENSLALENYEIEIKEPYYRAGVHIEVPNPQAVVKTTLYANLPNQETVIPIRKKSDLYNLVGDKSKLVKEYMKENKLSLNSLEDLQKILEYYVSLSK